MLLYLTRCPINTAKGIKNGLRSSADLVLENIRIRNIYRIFGLRSFETMLKYHFNSACIARENSILCFWFYKAIWLRETAEA